MSTDPEQEYFSDGITEDIITELSRFHSLSVIARKFLVLVQGSIDGHCSEIGRALGVRYVVEGSVRKVGRRVRITAQLIEAATGGHIWAERYDRDLEEIFTVSGRSSANEAGGAQPTFTATDAERRDGGHPSAD